VKDNDDVTIVSYYWLAFEDFTHGIHGLFVKGRTELLIEVISHFPNFMQVNPFFEDSQCGWVGWLQVIRRNMKDSNPHLLDNPELDSIWRSLKKTALLYDDGTNNLADDPWEKETEEEGEEEEKEQEIR
jgi:hypothetical protein